MTDNIDEMRAGRELDALVAERVMGLSVESVKIESWHRHPELMVAVNGGKDMLPFYSTDIMAAWLVVNKLKGIGVPFALEYSNDEIQWVAMFGYGNNESFGECSEAEGDNPAVAICRAALELVSK